MEAVCGKIQRYMLADMASTDLLKVCLCRPSQEAWRELVCRIQPVVAGSVARVARQYSIASQAFIEDLTQEVYVRLCEQNCRALREFQGDAPEALPAFIRVVASNIARDRCKATLAQKKGAGKVVPMPPRADDIGIPAADDNGAERELLAGEVDAILGRAPGATPDRDRSIFWLYYRQGWSSRDIAAIPALGLTQKGVESLLHRLAKFVKSELVNGEGARRVPAAR